MQRRSRLSPKFTLLLLALGSFDVGCGSSSKTASSSSGGSTATGSGGTGNVMVPLFDGIDVSTDDDAGIAVERCKSGGAEEGLVDVAVSDPGIRYVGRIVETADSVAFALPATRIETIFDGDAIDLKLRDHGTFGQTATNYYWVFIDGEARKLQVCPGRVTYSLARNLGAGPHSLTIVKRTEGGPGGQPDRGKGEFLGFRVRPGTTLLAPPKPSRLMEFVGDSITCGYGNELTTTTPDDFPFTSANEDAYNAYGAIAARAFEADYVAVAVSGRGVVRNYSGLVDTLVPAIYELSLPDDTTTWDHGGYTPDVVVVNLGTNDYSPGIQPDRYDAFRETFKQAYTDFLARIREVHATASIIAVVGPMMSDSYPSGYNALTSIQADIQAAVNARHANNDNDVHYLALAPQESPYGEDWHPTIATHQKMAKELQSFITKIRGW
jgi:lysophospholipase L1-like esterase